MWSWILRLIRCGLDSWRGLRMSYAFEQDTYFHFEPVYITGKERWTTTAQYLSSYSILRWTNRRSITFTEASKTISKIVVQGIASHSLERPAATDASKTIVGPLQQWLQINHNYLICFVISYPTVLIKQSCLHVSYSPILRIT